MSVITLTVEVGTVAGKSRCKGICSHGLAVGHAVVVTDRIRDVAVAESGGLPRWLQSRLPGRGVGVQSSAVLATIASQPSRASYGTAAELASLSGVSVATVTRTAQRLGFDGWPQLQHELRARYLSHLSAPQVAERHAELEVGANFALQRDVDGLALVTRSMVVSQITTVAAAMGSARRTYVVADGSYAALALALTHNVRLAGYDAEDVLDGGAAVANRVAAMGPSDVVLLISFWRMYKTALLAAQGAHAAGARVFLLTDVTSPDIAEHVEQTLVVPAEGSAFFPSLTSGLAVLQAIATELAALDPQRTQASVAAAEAEWHRFGLLHHRTGRT